MGMVMIWREREGTQRSGGDKPKVCSPLNEGEPKMAVAGDSRVKSMVTPLMRQNS